jgi:hypothetical protein
LGFMPLKAGKVVPIAHYDCLLPGGPHAEYFDHGGDAVVDQPGHFLRPIGMASRANPYETRGKQAGQKRGGRGGASGGGGDEGSGNTLAVYPVDNSKKDSVLDGIKASIARLKKDPSAIEWSGGIRERTGFLWVPRPLMGLVLNQSGNEVAGERLLIGSAGPPALQERIKKYFDEFRGEIVSPPGTVNLSDLPTKLDGVKGPEPWKYLLFLAARAAREQQMRVTVLKFEHNKLDKHTLFFGIQKLFPELSQVSLLGNDKLHPVLDQLAGGKSPFGPATVISWDGQIDTGLQHPTYEGWNSRIDFEDLSPLSLPAPKLLPVGRVMERVLSVRGAPRFDAFPLLNFNTGQPIEAFLAGFFDVAWHSMGSIGEFYFPDATFALTVDAAPATAQIAKVFGPVDGNLLGMSPMRVVAGRDEIVGLHFEIFKAGFYARPVELEFAINTEDLGLVVVRGVFQLSFDEKSVLAFDRSFMVLARSDVCAILSDHLFVREVPTL